jgi:hypothetical protein
MTGALVLITVAQLFTACKRRPLEMGDHFTALIPVNIDWSRSGVSTSDMHRATVMLFPEEGGMPLEYLLEGNLISRTIEVPVGVYSVLVFNETLNDTDWQGISFINTDDFHNFSAVGRAVTSRGPYTRATGLPLTENPESLAAWSLDRFEVTEDILARSRMTSRAALEREVDALTHVVPTPRIEQMRITANVRHLSSSMQATGTISGLASGVKMASGEKIAEQTAAHAFVLNNRKYDNDPDGRHGTTERTFNIFGHPQELTLKPMDIDFLLNDGTAHPTVSYTDVHSMIVRDATTIPLTNVLNVDTELPEVAGDSSITVSDWDEVIIPL